MPKNNLYNDEIIRKLEKLKEKNPNVADYVDKKIAEIKYKAIKGNGKIDNFKFMEEVIKTGDPRKAIVKAGGKPSSANHKLKEIAEKDPELFPKLLSKHINRIQKLIDTKMYELEESDVKTLIVAQDKLTKILERMGLLAKSMEDGVPDLPPEELDELDFIQSLQSLRVRLDEEKINKILEIVNLNMDTYLEKEKKYGIK